MRFLTTFLLAIVASATSTAFVPQLQVAPVAPAATRKKAASGKHAAARVEPKPFGGSDLRAAFQPASAPPNDRFPRAKDDAFDNNNELDFSKFHNKPLEDTTIDDAFQMLDTLGGEQLKRSLSMTTRNEFPPRPPLDMRAQISKTDAGTLVIDLPAEGFTSKSVMSGAFSIAWFSAIGPATVSGGLMAAPFLLPFWLAGGLVAKTAFVDPFVNTRLSIGEFGWSLQSSFRNSNKSRESSGSTDQLKGAELVDLTKIVEGKPRYNYELKLYARNGAMGIVNSIDPAELEYLAYVINTHMEKIRSKSQERNFDEHVMFGF